MPTSPSHSPLTNITKSYADAVKTPPVPIIGPNDPQNFLVLSQWRDNVETDGSEMEGGAAPSRQASTSPPVQEEYGEECGLHNSLCKGKHAAKFQVRNTLLKYSNTTRPSIHDHTHTTQTINIDVQPIFRIPSTSNISHMSNVVRPCGSCVQTALSCPGHNHDEDVHTDCGQPLNNCTCNDSPVFIPPPPEPKYVNVKPPHCTILDPATSWGVHTRATVAEEADKENQDPSQVPESSNEGVSVDSGVSFGALPHGHIPPSIHDPLRFSHYRGTHDEREVQKARDKADTPDGFELNIPPHFIPFHLHLNSHKEVAKYIHVPPAYNPIVYGCREKGGEIQYSEIHAAVEFDEDDAPSYMCDDLCYLHNDYGDCYGVNLALARIPDQLLWAEVQWYWVYSQEYDNIKRQLKALEDQQFITGHQVHKSV